MVDAFPSYASDSDFEIQSIIDAELENSSRVWQAYNEKRAPYPNDQALFPKLSATADRTAWLTPLIRRFVWHRDQGEAKTQWLKLLGEMVRLTLWQMVPLTEEQFLALAQMGPALLKNIGQGSLRGIAEKLSELEKKSPLSRELTAAAYDLLLLAEEGSWSSEIEQLVWPLLSGGTGLAELDRGWSVHIVRDLHAMKPKDRMVWLRAFAPTWYWRKMNTRSHQLAIEALGKDAIERNLRRWIAALGQEGGTDLSPIGSVLIRHVIGLCVVVDGNACDEMLYDIARAPWKRITVPTWPYLMLETLSRRPKDRAFACLEAMAMNPVTADHQVKREYEALLTVFGVRESAARKVGVDGFDVESDPELLKHHTRIDQLLRMAFTAVEQHRPVRPNPIRSVVELTSIEAHSAFVAMVDSILDEFGNDAKRLHRAATQRADWIFKHQGDFQRDTIDVWTRVMFELDCAGGLVQRALARVEELPLKSLIPALRVGGGHKALELCESYVAKHGWTPELVETIRKWIPLIGSAASDQIYRARAEWFVWWEDVCPIALDECWSHRVKRDLRAMPPEQGVAWRSLLEQNTFKYTGTPPRNWLAGADEAFAKVGLDDFRRRFAAWFEPFRCDETFRITITGRNILRLLMWYALIAKDAAVDEALVGFANARWKAKDSAARAALAEMAFSYVLSQRAPENAIPILEKYVASGQAFEGSKTHLIYKELCAKWNRTPVPAIPQKVAPPKAPAAAPVLLRRTSPVPPEPVKVKT